MHRKAIVFMILFIFFLSQVLGGSIQLARAQEVGPSGQLALSPSGLASQQVKLFLPLLLKNAVPGSSPPTVQLPAAPSNLNVSALSSTSLRLTWTDNSNNETGFEIERAPGGTTNFTRITTTAPNVSTYDNTGLSASTSYSYRVRAVNSAGASAYTTVASGTTQAAPTTPPTAPTGLSVSVVSSSSLRLTWTDNSNNEAGFEIERAPGGTTNFVRVTTTAPNASTYDDSSLSASTSYSYRVRAVNNTGASAYTNTATGTTQAPPVTPPTAPTNLAVVMLSSTSLRLTWTDNSDNETGFEIERAPGGTTNFTRITTVAQNVKTYDDSGLSVSTSYSYRVRAVNSAGSSAYSNTATGTPQAPPVTPPAAPSNLTASGTTTTSTNLHWTDNSSNESGFGIYMSVNGGSYIHLGDVAANQTSEPITEMTPGTLYSFKVDAFNAVGRSAMSNVASTTTLSQTGIRFINNTSHPIINLQIDGVQQFYYPNGIIVGGTYDVATSAGTHSIYATNGFWQNDGSRFEYYTFSGSVNVTSGSMYEVTFNDPTIIELLTRWSSYGYWSGEAYTYNPVTPHTAVFCFYDNGKFRFYWDGSQQYTGTYGLVSRGSDIVFFQVNNGSTTYSGSLYELYGYFNMSNGPADWPQIQYTNYPYYCPAAPQ